MPDHPYGWLSLLPPIVAILFAIATRRIVLSLVIGIFSGAMVMSGGDLLTAVHHTWETHLWRTLTDPGKLRVFSFTILMGAMIGVITKSGGMHGLIQLVSPYAKTRRRGQLATWLMGLIIFFDDYANTILLGSTLRPICDRLKISREKLAYLVDSTAAPVAGLAPLSTWVAVEIAYISSGLDSIPDQDFSAFGLFLTSIPYRFYIWSALLLIPITLWLGRDIGPMVAAEKRAIASHGTVDGPSGPDVDESPREANWLFAVLPIALTLALVIYFIFSTGSRGACASAADSAISAVETFVEEPQRFRVEIDRVREASEEGLEPTRKAIDELAAAATPHIDGESEGFGGLFEPRLGARDILGEADSSLALQYGALAGLLLAFGMPWVSRRLKTDELMEGVASGARVVLPAVAILWTASALSKMTTNESVDGETSEQAYAFQDHRLYTADYLTGQLSAGDGESTGIHGATPYLPTTVFVLAAVVAFCTGTSWGTMGILVPMVVQTAYALLSHDSATVSPDDPILLASIGGVLAGAVFGDHCSPISDTTVLSSQSTGCDHLAHVWTQMPYAILAAVVSIALGTLPIGFNVPVAILLPLQLIALAGLIRIFGRKVEAEVA